MNLEENLTEAENRLNIDECLLLLFLLFNFCSNIVCIQYCVNFRRAA